MLHGTPASEGIGLGRVMIVEEAKLEYNNVTVTDTEAEVERFRNAVKIFCDNTAAQADALKASAGKKEAEILEGHIQMMKDPYMCGEIEKLIDNGQCAEAALEYMCDMFISMFSATDDELTQQRAADVKNKYAKHFARSKRSKTFGSAKGHGSCRKRTYSVHDSRHQ